MADIQIEIHLIVDGIFSLQCIDISDSVSSGKNGVVISIKIDPTHIIILSGESEIVD